MMLRLNFTISQYIGLIHLFFTHILSFRRIIICWFSALSLLTSISLQAQEAPNHYIVLLDGSGSILSDYKYTYWQNQTNDADSMAQHVSHLVNLALKTGVSDESIPAVKPKDYVSFMMFNLEFRKPDYSIDKMFLSNQKLVLSSGLSVWQAYRKLDNSARNVGDTRKSLTPLFSGHSPLVAATTSALPYVTSQIEKLKLNQDNKKIGRIFIVRITDGAYNARANAADEAAVIIQTINAINRKNTNNPDKFIEQPKGYGEYLNIAQQINAAFDLSYNRVDCVLELGVTAGELKPMDCSDKAYLKAQTKGKGFMVSFMEANPRGSGLHALATVETTSLELQREARGGKIQFVENNRIVATGFEDELSEIHLNQVSWRYDGQSDYQLCDPGDNGVVCQKNGDEISIPRNADNSLPASASYQFNYDKTFKGKPRLYPFTYALPSHTIKVSLKEKELAEQDNRYYQPARDPDDLSFDFLNPLRVFSTAVDEPEYIPITDELLLSEAMGDEPLTAAELTRRSYQTKEVYLAQENYFNDLSKFIWAMLLGLMILAYFFKPRRKLKVDQQDVADGELLIDFNNRQYEQTVLLSRFKITNIAKTLYHKPFDLSMSLATPQSVLVDENGDDNDNIAFDVAERRGAPLSLVDLGKVEYEDPSAVTGKEYSVYLDPREIIDLPIIPGSAEHKVRVHSTVQIDAGNAGDDRKNISVNLVLKPEDSQLKIKRPRTIERDMEDLPVLSVSYRNGIIAGDLGHYLMSNNTHYEFSLPAKGQMSVEVRDFQNHLKNGVILLDSPEVEQAMSQIAFNINHSDSLKITLSMNFTELSNPVNSEDYSVVIRLKDAGESEWRDYDHWALRLERDDSRTEVSMQIIESELNHSDWLNADNPSGETLFVGLEEEPVKLSIVPLAGQNQTKLFDVVLANACENGRGYATWVAELVVLNEQDIELISKSKALYLVDSRGTQLSSGKLRDSHDENERLITLGCELHHHQINVLERDMRLRFKIKVCWEIFYDGEGNRQQRREFKNEITVDCIMRHEPPQNAIAIDSGTSGYAIAYSNGPGASKILPLQRRAKAIAAEQRLEIRYDNADKTSPFLSSECNVNLQPNELKTLQPDDSKFITLPLNVRAISQQPEKVFVGVKALFSSGYHTLPLSPEKFPYAGVNGDTAVDEPPLDMVMKGIYKGILTNYIEPILKVDDSSFSHIYLTHPNTYTPNHVRHLRGIVEEVFQGYKHGRYDRVYPDNIHFYSESDAVAFYYMLNVIDSYKGDWSKVPDCENVLVYDIGAGTLDLTHLQVSWVTNPNGGKTPAQVKVLHRGGVAKAGNLLDECIARDLHEFLTENLSEEDYINPIVVDDEEQMTANTRFEMDALRQNIQQLKVALSKGQPLKIPLVTTEAISNPADAIVRTRDVKTIDIYQEHENLVGTKKVEVFWQPTSNQITNGKYVKAFLQQVTQYELDKFFGDKRPKLDTVILSGRTSLWPGFEDKLRHSLGEVAHWENFQGDAEALKKAVALGVLEKASRWPDLEFISPGVIGQFGIRYEYSCPKDWQFFEFKRSGEEQEHAMHEATKVEVGLKSNNGFYPCITFTPGTYYNDDKMLLVTLKFDKSGYLQVSVKNSRGKHHEFDDIFDISVLSYSAQPWPIGEIKLIKQKPDDVMNHQH